MPSCSALCDVKITSFSSSVPSFNPGIGATVTFANTITGTCDSTKITVAGRNLTGTSWDGKNAAVQIVPPGNYTATLTATNSAIPNCSATATTTVTVVHDDCPNDPYKTEPGTCGCGAADIVSIQPASDNLLPGETTTVTSQTVNPSGAPLTWSISRVSGNASATLSTTSGSSTTVTNVRGEGLLRIRAENTNCYKEYTIRVGCDKCSGDQCRLIGAGNLGLKSIEATFSLGRTGEGRQAGTILLKATTMDPLNATPLILQYNSFNSDSEVLYDGGVLRQIVSPEGFVDIVTLTPYSYVMNFYRPADRGVKNGDFYQPLSGALPFVSWTVENPDASDTVYNRLRLTEMKNGAVTVNEYQWDEATQTWVLSKADGLQILGKSEEIIAGDRITTETVKNSGGEALSKIRTTWHAFSWGEEIVAKTVDPEHFALTTVSDYYATAGEPGYGQLKSTTNPDGSWNRYEYDADSRITREISSWLDAPLTAAASAAQVTEYDYTPLAANDSNLPEDSVRPRLVTKKTLGIVTEKTFSLFHRDATSNERTEITEQAVRPDALYGAIDNLRTVTVSYPETFTTPESGKPKSISRPDGMFDTYGYEYGTYAPAAGQPGVFTPGSGSDLRTTVTHATAASPNGIADETTRERTVSSKLGDTLLQEIQVYTGTAYEQIGWTVQVYDADGHVTAVHQSNGSASETDWGCCNKELETDSRGITTNFTEYDAMHRLLTSVTTGSTIVGNRTTTNTYDALGRQRSQTVSGGSLSRGTTTTYDTAGRVHERTDEADLLTVYDYSPDTLTETITHPGAITEINERYPDGQLKSVTGSGVVARYYSYGVNPDSSRWSQINLGAVDSPRWEKTTSDMLGRVIKTEKPGFTGVEATEFFYDSKGRSDKSTTPGQAATITTYDTLSRPLMTGLDTDNNGLLEANSTDRIQRTDERYVYRDLAWWQERSQSTYAADNDATLTQIGSSRVRLTGLGANGLVAENIETDANGNQTIHRTFIDRAGKRETGQVLYPDGTSTESVSENGLPLSAKDRSGVTLTYGYDALGRQTSVADPRTGAALTHYNSKGQVDYSEDAAGYRTHFGYQPDTGRQDSVTNANGKVKRIAFNTRSQITQLWGDTETPVQYDYNGYGEKIEQSTYRSGSYWQDELWPEATGPADLTTFVHQESSGLLTAKEDATGNATTYTYYPGGRLQTRTWARSASDQPLVTTYTYGPMTGELTGIDYSDATPDIHYTYYRHGQPRTVIDALGGRELTYTAALQKNTETINGLYSRSITQTYDQDTVIGRPTGLINSSGQTITYGYEPATGRLNRVSWQVGSQSGSADDVYEPNSHLRHSLSMGNRQTIYGYEDHRDLTTGITNRYGAGLISNYGYTYNALGLRETATMDEPTPRPVFSPSSTTYSANELNQYDSIVHPATAETLSYDEDGNLSNRTGITYVYNAENRLIEVAPEYPLYADRKVEFVYDYLGRRVEKKVSVYDGATFGLTSSKRFVYDGWNMIEEIDQLAGQAAASTYYIWGLDLSNSLQGAGGIGGLLAQVNPATNRTLYYLADANGNVTQLIDADDGSVAAGYHYDPFGNVISQTGALAGSNPFRFSTKYFDDETGLAYYGYRYYSPELGRWINRDPIGEEGGLNLYGFVQEEPVDRTDPLGLAQFGYRSLDRLGFIPPYGVNGFDDQHNTEWIHEQLWFDDGQPFSNIGFFGDIGMFNKPGTVRAEIITEHTRQDYTFRGAVYDDCIMRKAVKNIIGRWQGSNYHVVNRNCQDFADALRREYLRLGGV